MKATCSGSTSGSRSPRAGAFTLVELLMVIVVIATLAALLLPAIGAAIRKTREAAVSSEIQLLGQALADFKGRYGDYPPSRVLLCEDGNYLPYLSGASTGSTIFATPGATDQPTAALAARSLIYLRKFWPRMALATGGATPYSAATTWLDFNGNGKLDPPIMLTGDECLVWFVGGVAIRAGAGPNGKTVWALTGTGKDGRNPFPSSAAAQAGSRSGPGFEFKGDRLVDVDGDGYPSYVDSLATGCPYAYFSSYGGGYDPNDVNFDAGSPLVESDESGATLPIAQAFAVNFVTVTVTAGAVPNRAVSPPPNPYCATTTTAVPVGWMQPQSYQVLSAGVDGRYGVGGLYASSDPDPLPADPVNTTPPTDPSIRIRERDNLTNFHGSRLD